MPTTKFRMQTRSEPVPQRRDMHSTSMQLRSATLDEEHRSIEAVISTENPVRVYDWQNYRVIDEVLRTDGMESAAQVPMLDSHWRMTNDDVFGSVRNIRAETDGVVARLFFADVADQRIDRTWHKVRQGHLTDVSVGYRVLSSVDIAPGKSQTIGGKTYTAGDRTLRVATRWRLLEVSPTPIGADQAAKFRGDNPFPLESAMNPKLRKYLESLGLRAEATDDEARAFRARLTGDQAARAAQIEAEDGRRTDPTADPGENHRSDPPADPAADPTNARRNDPPADPPATPAAIASRAVANERDRVRGIRELAGADMDPALVQRAVDEGWDRARAAESFLQHVLQHRSAVPDAAPAGHVRDRTASVRSLAAGMLSGAGLDPLQCRMHDGYRQPGRRDALTEQDADAGDQFRSLAAVDLCRICADLDGQRYDRYDYGDCFRAAVSGATFSHVFSTNVNARLVEGYDTMPDTTVGWCDEEDVPNFLQQEDISVEASAALERLPRGGTANHAKASDSHETYKIARYAKQVVMDEQDIIDDRLGALLSVVRDMGEAARKVRPNLVYSLLLENPSLNADSIAVFASGSRSVTYAGNTLALNNLLTTALGLETLKAAVGQFGLMRNSNGDVLNLMPRFLIVPTALKWLAEELTESETLIKLFADSNQPTYSTRNPMSRVGLTPVVDDRIGANGVVDPRTGTLRTGSATNWFLTAGGSRGMRVAYLRGTGRGPKLRRSDLNRGQWGLGFDINLDIGAAFIDFKTWQKSSGAG